MLFSVLTIVNEIFERLIYYRFDKKSHSGKIILFYYFNTPNDVMYEIHTIT